MPTGLGRAVRSAAITATRDSFRDELRKIRRGDEPEPAHRCTLFECISGRHSAQQPSRFFRWSPLQLWRSRLQWCVRPTRRFFVITPASISEDRTPSCICRCGMNSLDSRSRVSSWRSTNRAAFGRCTRPTRPVLRRPRRRDSGDDRIPRRVSARQQGKISSLQWMNGSAAPRTARRVDTEKHEDVRFANGDVQLAGSLISPATSLDNPGARPPTS